ncbi:MAG: AraC family transcriptional regulator [Clostridia bacterium]|jgi:AraC-like DNA-binding protein
MAQTTIATFSDDGLSFVNMPNLLYAGQINSESKWFYPTHQHNEHVEVIYMSNGTGIFTIHNKPYRVGKGDIVIYNRGIPHEEKSNPSDPLETYYCGIGDLHIKGFEKQCLIPPNISPVIHAGKYSYKIESIISNIFEECSSQILGYEIVCQSLLMSLIVLILRVVNSQYDLAQTKESQRLSSRIKEYIDRNYTKNISLEDIANKHYISPHYLIHIFKDEMGDTPINYVINRRIDKAKKLLITTQSTVQEISHLVGYENANYFNTLFKKSVGMTPGEFRKKHMKIR